LGPSTLSASLPATAHAQSPLAAAGDAEGPEATSSAVQRAVSGLGGARPSLVLVFPDGGLDAGEQMTQAVANAAGAPVAGMTGSGAIGGDGPLDRGSSAIAFGPELHAAVAVVGNTARDLRGAARDAAKKALRELPESDGAHVLMALFLDTPSGDHSDALAGAFEVAGPSVPLVGGGAGGSSAWQLAEGSALCDSVVAVALRSPQPIGVGHAHGASPRGSPSVVTRVKGRTIVQLDGLPADAVYLEKLGHAGGGLSHEEFHRLAAVHPLAQPELSGDVRLRRVLGLGLHGGLECATHIPVNAAVEFTEQTPEAIVRSTWTAVSDALAPLGGHPARAALVFDCAGRRAALGGPGEQLDAELAALRASFGQFPPPLAGLYTRGEVGRVRGAKGDRSHAVVVAAFA
jgi:hypothetical protein